MPKATRRPARATTNTTRATRSRSEPDTDAKPIGRSKRPDYSQVAVYLPKALHRQIRIAAATDDREQADIIEDALTQWVERWQRSGSKRSRVLTS